MRLAYPRVGYRGPCRINRGTPLFARAIDSPSIRTRGVCARRLLGKKDRTCEPPARNIPDSPPARPQSVVDIQDIGATRSEERRVGKEGVSTGRSRGDRLHKKIKIKKQY